MSCNVATAVIVVVVMMITLGVEANKYCQLSSQHTMCKYKGLGSACGSTVPGRGVKPAERQMALDEHNKWRAKVANGRQSPQPSAANMAELVWDEELAKVAQRHIEQCVFRHDCNACRKVSRFSVGQNLYSGSSSRSTPNADWKAAVKGWYDEVKDVNPSIVNSYQFSGSTGHYTQLVWAKTTHLGCGFVMFKKGSWYTKMYGCNYGPAGNMMGAPMYQRGAACSKCQKGCSSKNKGLCKV